MIRERLTARISVYYTEHTERMRLRHFAALTRRECNPIIGPRRGLVQKLSTNMIFKLAIAAAIINFLISLIALQERNRITVLVSATLALAACLVAIWRSVAEERVRVVASPVDTASPAQTPANDPKHSEPPLTPHVTNAPEVNEQPTAELPVPAHGPIPPHHPPPRVCDGLIAEDLYNKDDFDFEMYEANWDIDANNSAPNPRRARKTAFKFAATRTDVIDGPAWCVIARASCALGDRACALLAVKHLIHLGGCTSLIYECGKVNIVISGLKH